MTSRTTQSQPPTVETSSKNPAKKGVIQQLDDSSYALEIRGAKMVLERTKRSWRVKTTNASSRVWSMGGESWKEFPDLEGVEKHYKSWRGIAALVAATGQQAQ